MISWVSGEGEDEGKAQVRMVQDIRSPKVQLGGGKAKKQRSRKPKDGRKAEGHGYGAPASAPLLLLIQP